MFELIRMVRASGIKKIKFENLVAKSFENLVLEIEMVSRGGGR